MKDIKTPQIPQQIKDFIFENRGYFNGEIELEDIDGCLVCTEMNTKELIIYDAVCVFENGAYILEWNAGKKDIQLKLNGAVLLDEKNELSLNYKDVIVEYK